MLSEFRSRLVKGKAEQTLLDTLLARVRELGLLKSRGRQRTDSTHVLAAVRMLNRLERVGETLRATLNALAVGCPGVATAGRGAAVVLSAMGVGWRTMTCLRPKPRGKRWRARSGPTDSTYSQAIDAATDQAWLQKVPPRADPTPGLG